MRIDACYDSHVHWAATGEFIQQLRLGDLASPGDILSVRPEKQHFRGEWLTGFGWDDNKWNAKPSRAELDQWFPNSPVALSRCDGHALWCNTEALKRAGLMGGAAAAEPKGGRIERDDKGLPTGLLVDQAMEIVENLIPPPTAFEVRRHLLEGVHRFNLAGFTHIRDMTSDETQWNEAVKIDGTGLLTLAVEKFFRVQNPGVLDSVLTLMEKAKAEAPENLRVKGIKIFLDGALGSEGAWLSKCYCGRSHSGLRLWEENALREIMIKTWEKGFDVACHAIGDEAADLIVRIAAGLNKEGRKGVLHIEHGEIIRGDTIEKMRGLPFEVHLQPSHWLTDQAWLKNKVGDLIEHAFPWRRLQEAEVPFDFGSDAPIEPASIGRTFQALRQSAEAGIPRLLGMPNSHMSHKDLSWAPNSFTLLEEETPVQVVFRGENLV
jgi:predicted amidohydrolase YtcJ